MKSLAPLVLLSAVITACTASPPPQQADAVGIRCIMSDQIVGRRLAGANAVEFDVLGGTTYLNQLARACPGLERLDGTAIVAITGGADPGRLCAGDRVQIFDPVEVKATGLKSYPFCQLGKFTVTSAPGTAIH